MSLVVARQVGLIVLAKVRAGNWWFRSRQTHRQSPRYWSIRSEGFGDQPRHGTNAGFRRSVNSGAGGL